MAREVKIEFLGDASDLNRATKSASDDLSRFSKHAGVTAGVTGAAVSAGINAAAAGARALAGVVGSSLKEAEDAAQVTRVQAKLLETTGNAAKVTSKQLDSYATSLSNMTGIDDELIAAGQNVLLTFRNVRNEQGKGNNIFDRATKAGLDLSAVLGTDLKAANIQLGKALQDPIKGTTALGRAGVQFTKTQKDQIKALVEAGDVLGAQKIILGEVEQQVGGAAEANATATMKLTEAWDNTKEALGTTILPAFTALTDYLVGTLLPVVQELVGEWGPKIGNFFAMIGEAFAQGFKGDTVAGLDGIAGAMQRVGEAVGKGFDVAVALLKDLGKWAQENKDALQVAAAGLSAMAGAMVAIGAANKAGSAVQSVAQAVMGIGAGLGPWGLLAVAIIAIGAAAYVAYQKFPAFKEAVDATWQALQDGAHAVVDFLTGVFAPAWNQVSDEVIGAGQAIAEFFTALWQEVLQPLFEAGIAVISAAWRLWGDNLISIAQAVWQYIRDIIEAALRIIQGIFQVMTAALTGDWGKAWDGIKNIASGAVSFVTALIQGWVRIISSVVVGLGELLLQPFKYFADHVGGFFEGIGSLITGIFRKAVDAVKGYVNDLIGIINAAINAYNKIPLAPDIPNIPSVRGAVAPPPATRALMPVTASALGVRATATAAPAATFGAARVVNINLPTGVNGHDVIDAVRRYNRRNGRTAWVTS